MEVSGVEGCIFWRLEEDLAAAAVPGAVSAVARVSVVAEVYGVF